MERPHSPEVPKRSESVALTDKEKVFQALEHSLTGTALERWMAMKSAGTPESSFTKWVEDFNASSPEERGKGKYDHNRPLTEHVDVSLPLMSPSGHAYQVTLHKNGEVTLQQAPQA